MVAINPTTGSVVRKVVLDSPDIASTKELVTLRTDRTAKRLYIANGSDESATILSLPALTILREITIEGEPIRDALPDPKGRYVYLLGRRVHVYDARGTHELRTLPIEEPTAIAASASTVAVFERQSVTILDAATFAETAHRPLPAAIESAVFSGEILLAASRDGLFEISPGALIRDSICLPEESGPQITALAAPSLLLFAERRCESSAFAATDRTVLPASLYGVDAYALAYDHSKNVLCVTDRAGYLTIYRVPRAPIVK